MAYWMLRLQMQATCKHLSGGPAATTPGQSGTSSTYPGTRVRGAPPAMSHLRSALHAGAYTLVLLATLVVLTQSTSDAQAAISTPGFASSTTAAPAPDEDMERALLQREKRVSRAAARREARPAPVAKRVTISKITWALPMTGYHLTGRFGDTSSMWSSGMHTGLDFAAPAGT